MQTTVITGDNQASPKFAMFMAGIFAVVGLILGVFVPSLITQTVTPETIQTTGTITGFTESSDDPSMVAENYSFQTKEGQTINIRSSMWSNVPAHQLNDQIEIYYNPSEPQKAWIKDDPTEKLLTLIMRIVGGVMLVVGVLLFVFRNKIRNRSVYISKTVGNVDFNDFN